ncbi:trehalose-phosphatase, partial [Oharaeibacter diazotrophicus]
AVDRPAPPAGLAAVRAAIAAEGVAASGVLVEDKGGSIALHYRDVPARGAATVAFARRLVGADPDLAALAGKMVVEIKPKAASKAAAVHRFMGAAPFAGRRPVFVGDDVTDEDGMRAALAAGGRAVKVGPGVTVAGARLPDPAAVLAWLDRLLSERT